MISLTFPDTNQIVRHEMIDGEPWFHAGDVCRILNLKNPAQTLAPIEAGSKKKFDMVYAGSDPWFLDEEGLYTIAWRCRDAIKPGTVAYQFRKWVIGVIKTIRKTGQYTATASDQQYFEPFGITLERKIGECDRAIAAASITTGEIGKIAASRKVLERLYKENPMPKAKAEDTRLQRFIAAYRGKFGDNEFIPSELCRKIQAMKSGPLFDAAKDICFFYGTKQFVPNLLGKFLQANQDVVVDGWKIQKLTRSKHGQRWAVVKA